MKVKKSFVAVTVILTSLILLSCDRSVKGNWSASDKQKFYRAMNNVEELSALGTDKEEWLECYLEKAEANYSSFFEADSDTEGCKKMANACAGEIMSHGSVKGFWSEVDKERFYTDMQKVDALSFLGDQKNEWIECYLQKCENKYSSYYEADSDEDGLRKIANECFEAIP